MNDFWLQNTEVCSYAKLEEDIKTKVLVIGGGIAGMLCAYRLTKLGIDNVLVEKSKIGSGITSKTTATITAITDKPYYKIYEDSGYEKTLGFLKANLKAIQEYKLLSKELDFDFEELSGMAYSVKSAAVLSKEYATLQELGYKVIYHKDIELDLNVEGALEYPKQGQCNPLKLIYEISKRIQVYEDTCIDILKRNYAITSNGKRIDFDYAIVATHYPFKDKKGLYYAKMYQNISKVFVLDNQDKLKYFYNDIEELGMYVRSYNNYLIYGGNDYRVGMCKSSSSSVERYVLNTYKVTPTYKWINQDLITLDNMPYVGKISYLYNNIFVSTGFNGYGMTSSMIGSMLICDYITHTNNPYFKVFSPQRPYLLKPFFKQVKSSVTHLLKFKGKRCSHLGCKLIYNDNNKTYECYCHGSRFEKNGKVINSPAKHNI